MLRKVITALLVLMSALRAVAVEYMDELDVSFYPKLHIHTMHVADMVEEFKRLWAWGVKLEPANLTFSGTLTMDIHRADGSTESIVVTEHSTR